MNNTMRYIFTLLYGGDSALAIPVSGARGESRPFTLVIDAGHGGHDVGAVDNGARGEGHKSRSGHKAAQETWWRKTCGV